MIHEQVSEFAGKKVKIKETSKHNQDANFGGSEFFVEDWWDKLSGKTWGSCEGNPACIVYSLRVIDNDLPLDNEVVYGKTPDGLGHLLHVSEIEKIFPE
jgi:hypothetical protein